MKSLLTRLSMLTVVFASVIAVVGLAGAAEKQKFAYTKNARQMFAETKITPVGGPAGRELAQMMYVDTKVTATGWDMMEERCINQDDQIEGSGKHKGVCVDIMKNGDTIFQVYEGTHKTTVKEGGAWEVNYQGTMRFDDGTGNYKNAKGKGTYKGRVTADSFIETGEGEIAR